MGRQAKGVRLIRLDSGRKLASIVAFDSDDNGSENSDGEGDGGSEKDTKDEVGKLSVEDKMKAAIRAEQAQGDVPSLEESEEVQLKPAVEDDDLDSDVSSEEKQQSNDTQLTLSGPKSPVAELIEDDELSVFDRDDDSQTMIF